MSQFPPIEPSGPAGFQQQPQGSSGMAIAALVLGLIALPTSCVGVGVLLGLVALILGIVALNQISSEGNRVGGRGMAIAGIVLGSLSMAMIFVALLIGMLLPALGAARRTARQMTNNTQVRDIHQAMVMYAQGNASYFPGVSGRASTRDNVLVADGTVEGRLQLLLDGNYFAGTYLVSPSESLSPWTGGAVTSANYSYAILEILTPGGRQGEWSETLNTDAAVMSDRNAGTANDVYSVHTESGDGWRGTVGYNDNHVVFESVPVLSTRYSGGAYNTADDLFVPAGADDAWMIHRGDGSR